MEDFIFRTVTLLLSCVITRHQHDYQQNKWISSLKIPSLFYFILYFIINYVLYYVILCIILLRTEPFIMLEHFRYITMSPDRFEYLLCLVVPLNPKTRCQIQKIYIYSGEVYSNSNIWQQVMRRQQVIHSGQVKQHCHIPYLKLVT